MGGNRVHLSERKASGQTEETALSSLSFFNVDLSLQEGEDAGER